MPFYDLVDLVVVHEFRQVVHLILVEMAQVVSSSLEEGRQQRGPQEAASSSWNSVAMYFHFASHTHWAWHLVVHLEAPY